MTFPIITRTRRHSWQGCLPKTNDERRAAWAAKYYGQGYHHRIPEPRIRAKTGN